MPLSLRVRRLGYRVAYRLLTVWWCVRRPETEGVKCLLTHGQEVLLVQHTYGPVVWDLPGGALKRHEPPVSAAEREMAEELGVADADWQATGIIHGRQSFRHDKIHCFRAELPSRTVTPNAAELAETRWFPRRALPDELGLYAAAILRDGRR